MPSTVSRYSITSTVEVRCTCLGSWLRQSDATPAGRASDALRAQLPEVFPEFVFEFVGPEELESERAPANCYFVFLAPRYIAKATVRPSAKR
jgi:hypothetical protein